nr:MAG TPA: hypothetical protein [Caudoviricetes sp.]
MHWFARLCMFFEDGACDGAWMGHNEALTLR